MYTLTTIGVDEEVQGVAKGELAPALATSWEPVDDTLWRVMLRDDVTWQGGEAFTAECF